MLIKARSSAFSNLELEQFLRAERIGELYVLGVFAEGCVRATVLDARHRGHGVQVIADAVATNVAWKKAFALWAMRSAGAKMIPSPSVPQA